MPPRPFSTRISTHELCKYELNHVNMTHPFQRQFEVPREDFRVSI